MIPIGRGIAGPDAGGDNVLRFGGPGPVPRPREIPPMKPEKTDPRLLKAWAWPMVSVVGHDEPSEPMQCIQLDWNLFRKHVLVSNPTDRPIKVMPIEGEFFVIVPPHQSVSMVLGRKEHQIRGWDNTCGDCGMTGLEQLQTMSRYCTGIPRAHANDFGPNAIAAAKAQTHAHEFRDLNPTATDMIRRMSKDDALLKKILEREYEREKGAIQQRMYEGVRDEQLTALQVLERERRYYDQPSRLDEAIAGGQPADVYYENARDANRDERRDIRESYNTASERRRMMR